MFRPLALAAALAFAWPAAASAQVVYENGFEPVPNPAPGQPFPTVPVNGPWIMGTTTGTASVGSGSYYIEGWNLAHDTWAFQNLYTGTDVPIPAGTGRVRFTADVRIDSSFPDRPDLTSDLISANLIALDGKFRPIAEVSASADGHAYGRTPAGVRGANAGVAAVGAFHRLGMDLNFVDGTALFTLDGASLGTDLLAPGLTAADFRLGKIEIVGEPASGSYRPQHYRAYFDEVRIEAFPAAATPPAATPEPTTLGLAAIGGLALLTRRLRRRGPGERGT